jgi:uncharacterized protein (DUF1810 family)
MSDLFKLDRFVAAQDHGGTYDAAVSELRAGRKRSHWMWFVFPQIAELGQSPTSRRYAISSLAEAEAYLAHPVLGRRLTECAEIVRDLQARSADEIFGGIDAMKLRSSMTLFAQADPANRVFREVLEAYFEGARDQATERLLASGGWVAGADDRFADHRGRGKHRDDLDRIISEWAAKHDATEIDALLSKPEEEWLGGNSYFTAGAIRTVHGGLEDVLSLVEPIGRARVEATDLEPYGAEAFREDMRRLTRGPGRRGGGRAAYRRFAAEGRLAGRPGPARSARRARPRWSWIAVGGTSSQQWRLDGLDRRGPLADGRVGVIARPASSGVGAVELAE